MGPGPLLKSAFYYSGYSLNYVIFICACIRMWVCFLLYFTKFCAVTDFSIHATGCSGTFFRSPVWIENFPKIRMAE